MNKIKWFKVLPICMFTMLSACQSADTSAGTVQRSIEASSAGTVQRSIEASSSGDSQSATEYQCYSTSKQVAIPTEIKKWEVVDQEPVIDSKYPDSKYSVVSARIESMSMGGFPVTRTWKFEVWKSDDLFEFRKRLADKENRLLKDDTDLLNETANLVGGQPTSPPPMWIPDRKEISSKLYCITGAEAADGF